MGHGTARGRTQRTESKSLTSQIKELPASFEVPKGSASAVAKEAFRLTFAEARWFVSEQGAEGAEEHNVVLSTILDGGRAISNRGYLSIQGLITSQRSMDRVGVEIGAMTSEEYQKRAAALNIVQRTLNQEIKWRRDVGFMK